MTKIIKRGDIKIKMVIDTPYELDRFNTFYTKEPETISWIEQLIMPRDVFYDVGANVGVFSLFARVFHGRRLKVFSFEPCYHNFSKLCVNIVVNKFQDNITPFCIALGDKTGLDFLNVISGVSGSSGHNVGIARNQLGKKFKPGLKQGIFSVTLDEVVERFGIPRPNHIKIDTDGFEENILKGGRSVFRDSHLRSVLIEVTDIKGAGEKAKKIMSNYGFGVTHLINFQKNHSRIRREKSGKGMIKNLIFTRP